MRFPLGPLVLAVASCLLALIGPGTASAATRVVNTASDHAPNGCDAGDCTLREAILEVQDTDTIAFNIPGAGPHIIQLDTAMDGLFRQGVTIDGYTQPGASPNTAAAWAPGNADIRIVLDGSTITGLDSWGLWLSAKNLTIKGLSFVNFDDEAIKFATFPSAAIKGNYIGLYPDGTTVGSNLIGITLRSSEPGNLIGGSAPADRNVISGNTETGLAITGSNAVVVAGNFIGTDASGTLALPNDGNGIDMAGGPFSTVGGAVTGAGNLISGNGSNGIAISTPDGRGINVKGNRIGTTGNGLSPLPNAESGVYLTQAAFDITIGGEFDPNEENIIAFNGGAGVSLAASAGVQSYIDPNVMHSNGGLGADLLDDGLVLANDPGDADTGPNNLMNYPVITSAILSGTKLTVSGELNTVPSKYNNMFFFTNTACDPSGYGEAEKFLGSLGVNSGPTGTVSFQRVFNNPPLNGRGWITMAASDPESSSEFSACVPVDVTADYNCDAAINSADVLILLQEIGTGEGSSANPGCTPIGVMIGDTAFGDADCDDELSLVDALVLLIGLAGATQLPLPPGCNLLLTP